MNKNRFRRVFSKRHGMLVAVAEDVTSQGKAPGEGNASSSSPQSAKMGVIATMTAFALAMFASTPATSFAQALPTGGQVTAGQASISQNSNTMTINQGTQRAVIDWNSFNVGQGNTVQFNQPNAQAQALNRVTGAGASNIQGSLLANGQVLIQNANGVLFGKGAVVNVGSLLATTKSIDANQFMSGGPLKLSGTGKNASVVNDGTINAQGYVTLMGDQVRNTGSIDAGKNGQVALAAGDSATVALANGQGIQLTLNNATANALVENSGTIKADIIGGDSLSKLSGTQAQGMLQDGVQFADFTQVDSGATIKADAAHGDGGFIETSGHSLSVQGNLSAAAPNGKGGEWLIDPTDVTISTGADANYTGGMSGFTPSGNAATVNNQSISNVLSGGTNVTITTASSGTATGNIVQQAGADTGNGTGGISQSSGTSLNISGSGTVDLDGTSTNGNGVTLNGDTSVTDNGTLHIDGNSTTNGSGVVINGDTNVSGHGSVDIDGNAANGSGVVVNGDTSVIENGSLNIDGNSSKNGNGVVVNGDVDVSDNGHANIDGHANNGSGVVINGDSNVTDKGTLNIDGNSATNGSGVVINGDTNVSGNGSTDINGNAANGSGVVIDGNTSVIENGTLNIDGNSSKNGDGDANNGNGVVIDGNTSTSNGSSLNIDGNSSTNGDGVIVNGDVNTDGNSSTDINGEANNGNGVVIDGNTSTSNDSSLNIDGNSSTNGDGVIVNGDVNTDGNSSTDINGALPMGVLHDMYMHCSYADLPGKHDIKKPINTLIRRKLASLGIHDVERQARPAAEGQKPVLLVVLEWFSKNHSIYRTHSQTIVAMRDKFHIIGMGYDGRVDEAGREVFHEFIPLQGDLWQNMRQVRDVSEAREAQAMYMPSVGMFPITMGLACLRVAPLQLMALGHPATTHGHAMDYVVVEEDYVGDEACFSEKLLKLPQDGMPYRPPAAMLEVELEPRKRAKSDPVKIAVAATTIKLNPGFLQTCADIANEASVPVEFHFLVGQATGITFPQVRNLVRRLMGDKGVVHKHQSYANYMKVIADCDMFLNPFPFGNTNGIVDTVWAGLVGVCKTGREVHEHIDEGMFRRLGFPEWMITKTTEEYKAAALRLIDDSKERNQLARKFAGRKAVEKLIFKGRPEILGERIRALLKEKADIRRCVSSASVTVATGRKWSHASPGI
ncbi:filamentous hemagglutinin N-terminal domain-containing protein [Caballeronia sp. ATUFL_F1_KS4A]|uniref:two-partner secretion domain-containing protein n=1 Tax=Caballeronia sp. ATUFL_F1_KS4A TaxID=2921768 RepID=UPI0025411952|nr:filamentous hemagglutinin N-terminal domain-containing protein [Caballeronia sp. ATUFL_F1_KS4A]